MDARCCASVCARSFGIFVYRFVLADGGGCCCCCCCWLLCHRCFPCQTFTTAYRHRDIKLNISVVGSVRWFGCLLFETKPGAWPIRRWRRLKTRTTTTTGTAEEKNSIDREWKTVCEIETEREKRSIEITWKIELADEFLMTDYLYAHQHTHTHTNSVLNGEYRANAPSHTYTRQQKSPKQWQREKNEWNRKNRDKNSCGSSDNNNSNNNNSSISTTWSTVYPDYEYHWLHCVIDQKVFASK